MCLIFSFISFLTIIFTVGNYSDLNPDGCGLSRHSIGVNTTCMKWHKDILSPMRGAKRVGLGDAPWAALLVYSKLNDVGREVPGYRCSASVFGNEWILTAAHCMARAFNIKIYFGYNFSKEKPSAEHQYEGKGVFIHPKYNISASHLPIPYDIALVKMNKPIENSGKRFLVNNICLPEIWSGGDCRFKPTPNCQTREYAMIAGWGSGKYPGPTYLQIGYWRLYNERYGLSTDPNDRELSSKMSLDRLANHSICVGDSGSPVWQYHLGRAVIIGVVVNTRRDDMFCTTTNYPSSSGGPQSTAIWVDQEIDWIQGVIKNITKKL